jgi:hypothetical protein
MKYLIKFINLILIIILFNFTLLQHNTLYILVIKETRYDVHLIIISCVFILIINVFFNNNNLMFSLLMIIPAHILCLTIFCIYFNCGILIDDVFYYSLTKQEYLMKFINANVPREVLNMELRDFYDYVNRLLEINKSNLNRLNVEELDQYAKTIIGHAKDNVLRDRRALLNFGVLIIFIIYYRHYIFALFL